MVTRRRQGRRGVTGALIILGLAGLGALIILLDDIRDAFADGFTLVGVFPEAHALEAGTPVWIAGRPAGSVTRVEMLRPGSAGQDRFAATLRVRSAYARLLRRDSELTIATRGLLSRPVVQLMPGSVASPPLAPGDTLVARRPVALRQLQARTDTVRRAIESLDADGRRLDARARAGWHTVQAAVDALGAAGDEFGELAVAFDQGTLGRFAGDGTLHASLARIRASAEEIGRRVDARLARVRDPDLAEALARLAARADTIRAHAEALEAMLESESDGFLARWQADPALRQAFAAVRAQVDSLVAEARRAPWRWVL